MSSEVGQDINKLNKEAAIKRAPSDFEDEDDDIGEVEEGVENRGRPGVRNNYQSESNPTTATMQIDQRGSLQKRRASSCKLTYKNSLIEFYSQEKE